MPSHVESSLEAGLVALKQGNYQAAITELEPIASSPGNGNASLQAQVGLVMAYARSGGVNKAIALCENLIQSNNPQVQEWAGRALEHLTRRKNRDQSAQKIPTGFVAFDNPSLDSPKVAAAPQQQPKQTALEPNTPNSPALPASDCQNLETNPANSGALPVSGGQNILIEAPAALTSGFIGAASNTKAQPESIYWRQARRAKVWQPLRKPNLIPSRLLAIGTFIAFFCVLREILKLAMGIINDILVKLPFLEPLQLLYYDPTPVLLLVLVSLTAASPWLLDWLLADCYSQQQLTKEALHNYSREAVRVLQRTSQQQHRPLPKLRILPIAAPMMLTYGHLPRTARIVVSQGLLEQLADDEIATIYALSLGQIGRWDLPVMSLVLLATLPFYSLYRQASVWADNIKQRIWRWPYTFLASLAYGIWCLLTGTALLNSRLRLYQSDRTAAEITGNPNALIRALLKMTIGIAGDIAKVEHTSWQLESLNLLMPVGYQQSLSLGSIAGYISYESLLMWENYNPYRRWLTINNTHPLIGDRIERLCQIARHWHLDTELHLTSQQSIKLKPQSFLLQIAPWLGIPLGLVFAGLLRLTWQLLFALKLLNLKWIYQDWSFVTGCLLIGFSIGTVIRINSFFPDIKPATVQTDDQLPNLLANPSALPIDSISVRLVGKLLGRSGISNCLAQDLILQTSTGLVKLHHIAGPGQSVNPQDWIGRRITVTGWFRRGATPWVDIHTLQTQNGKTIHSLHPIWSTILAIAAQAWGAYIFLTS